MLDNTKPRRGFALCVSPCFPLAIPVAALVAAPVCFSVIVGHGVPTWKRTIDACLHHHWTKNMYAATLNEESRAWARNFDDVRCLRKKSTYLKARFPIRWNFAHAMLMIKKNYKNYKNARITWQIITMHYYNARIVQNLLQKVCIWNVRDKYFVIRHMLQIWNYFRNASIFRNNVCYFYRSWKLHFILVFKNINMLAYNLILWIIMCVIIPKLMLLILRNVGRNCNLFIFLKLKWLKVQTFFN